MKGQTCVVFWIELQVLFVPRHRIVDGNDEIRHVLPDILLLLALLLEDAGPVGKCERPISRKPEKDSVEKIIAEFTVFPTENKLNLLTWDQRPALILSYNHRFR